MKPRQHRPKLVRTSAGSHVNVCTRCEATSITADGLDVEVAGPCPGGRAKRKPRPWGRLIDRRAAGPLAVSRVVAVNDAARATAVA